MMQGSQRLIVMLVYIFAQPAYAQRPFTEGIIAYDVKLEAPGGKSVTGVYILYVKGDLLRKDLKLSNGYSDEVIFSFGAGKGTSLQVQNGKKYAIELDMQEVHNYQDVFRDYRTVMRTDASKHIAGYETKAATIYYTSGDSSIVYFTNEWKPAKPLMYERYPSTGFLPLFFNYNDEHGMTMWFEATRVTPGPVANALFQVPVDYKIISAAEYKTLSR